MFVPGAATVKENQEKRRFLLEKKDKFIKVLMYKYRQTLVALYAHIRLLICSFCFLFVCL